MHPSQSQRLLHNNPIALILILLLRNPHILKVSQLRQNTPSTPTHNIPLRRRKRPNLHLLPHRLLHFVHEAVGQALEHCVAAGQHDVVVQGLSEVDVDAGEAVEHELGERWVFEADALGGEEDLAGESALGGEFEDGAIR